MKDRLPDILRSIEREPLQDACGIVGILSSKEDTSFEIGLLALQQLQTRGYDGAGFIGLREDESIVMHKQEGTVREVFNEGIVSRIKQNSFYHGQYQVRYGTSGEFSPENVQPFVSRHACTNEIFVVSHNGQFSRRAGQTNEYQSDTKLFVERISHSDGDSWDERIINTLKNEKGAYSLIIGTADCMYLSRDPLGVRPLYFSQKENDEGNFITIAASETEALLSAGFDDFSEVRPGELLKFKRNSSEYQRTQIFETKQLSNCIFENVYTQDERGKAFLPRVHSTEVNTSPTVADVRARCGEVLAHEGPLTRDEVDFVIGIPGTAITGGEAYARALDLPYFQAITDKQSPAFEERTFMQAKLEGILKKVKNHFNFDYERLNGASVVLVDDSIVRGNISQGLVQLLKEQYGVKSVHMRVLCPPIDKPCYLGINTRARNELIAANYKTIDEIRAQIGADSLVYLSEEGLLKAVSGFSSNIGFCMGCMLGNKPPIDQYGIPVNVY